MIRLPSAATTPVSRPFVRSLPFLLAVLLDVPSTGKVVMVVSLVLAILVRIRVFTLSRLHCLTI